MLRRLIIGLLSALALAGLAGLTVPAAASAAATAPSKEYIALETAKVYGAFHVLNGTGSSSAAAEAAAHAACAKYLAQAGAEYSAQDCNSAEWVQYGYLAYADWNPGALAANDFAWGYGYAPTKAEAISYAQSYCKSVFGIACPNTGVYETPNYAGSPGTRGGGYVDPLGAAVTWELAHAKTNPATGNNWITPVSACEQAVEQAYGVPPNHVPPGYTNALADYNAQKAAGRIWTGPNAPRGALVFFDGADPTLGHVGLAVGDGKHYWTVDGGTINEQPYSEGIDYKGWSYAPADWPGVLITNGDGA